MSTVDPNLLEQLIAIADVGERTARKLRKANEGEQPPAARGHGAPRAETPVFGTL